MREANLLLCNADLIKPSLLAVSWFIHFSFVASEPGWVEGMLIAAGRYEFDNSFYKRTQEL